MAPAIGSMTPEYPNLTPGECAEHEEHAVAINTYSVAIHDEL
ncbi:MAG: hypothetical protein ACLP51_08690 [Syntrophobacteraceae bacterium]